MKRKVWIWAMALCLVLSCMASTALAWGPTAAGNDGDELTIEVSYDNGAPSTITFDPSEYGPGFYKQQVTLDASATVMSIKVVSMQTATKGADGSRTVTAVDPADVALSFQNKLGNFEGVNESGTFHIPVKYLDQVRGSYDYINLQANGSVAILSLGESSHSAQIDYDFSKLAGHYIHDHHEVIIKADGTATVDGKTADTNVVTPIFGGGTVSADQELKPKEICVYTYDANLYFTYAVGSLTYSRSGGANQLPPDYMTVGTVFTKGQLIESVEVTGSAQGLAVGDTAALSGKVLPETATEDRTLTWSSSDEAVATVNPQGVVTAKKLGSATIQAETACGEKATITVTVVKDTTPVSQLPKDDILDAIAPDAPVEVVLSQPTTVDSSILQALKDQGGSLVVGVTNAAGQLDYEWTIAGAALTDASIAPNLALNRQDKSGAEALDGQFPVGTNVVLNFSHNGALPGAMSVLVDVTNYGFKAGDSVRLYYLNTQTQKLEAVSNPVTLQERDGRLFASLSVDHCSSYLLTTGTVVQPTATPTAAPTAIPTTPQTGDAAPFGWLLLAFVAVAGGIATLIVRQSKPE